MTTLILATLLQLSCLRDNLTGTWHDPNHPGEAVTLIQTGQQLQGWVKTYYGNGTPYNFTFSTTLHATRPSVTQAIESSWIGGRFVVLRGGRVRIDYAPGLFSFIWEQGTSVGDLLLIRWEDR